jgi:hypothetical protein
MHIGPLAENRVYNPNHNEANKIQSVQLQEPFSVTARRTNKPERPNGKHYISQRAMKPSIKHLTVRRILQGIEICLNHFPEEVQKKTGESNRDFGYSGTPMSGQTVSLF